MRWSDVQFDPPKRVLRQFAGLWLVIIGGMGAWQAWGHGRQTLGAALATAAVAVGLAGLLRPSWAKPVFVAAQVLTFPIGWVVSHLILGFVYFGLITPLALAFRLTGRDALALSLRRGDPSTYWEPKPQPEGAASYLRMH